MDDSDTDINDVMLKESRRTFDQQVSEINSQKDRAIEIVKINLLVSSLVIALLQIGGSSHAIAPRRYIGVAFIPIAISTLISLISYIHPNHNIGLNQNAIRNLPEKGPEEEFQLELAKFHSILVGQNSDEKKWLDRGIVISLVLTSISLGMITGVIIFDI